MVLHVSHCRSPMARSLGWAIFWNAIIAVCTVILSSVLEIIVPSISMHLQELIWPFLTISAIEWEVSMGGQVPFNVWRLFLQVAVDLDIAWNCSTKASSSAVNLLSYTFCTRYMPGIRPGRDLKVSRGRNGHVISLMSTQSVYDMILT